MGSIKHWSLEEAVTKETIYFPLAQSPAANFTVVVQASAAPLGLASAVRRAVLSIDPEQPVYDMKTMVERVDESLQPRRAPMQLLAVFAGIAVFLAALGIYGVLAFSVGQRTNEIGVRMALGADRSSILRLVLRQGATLLFVGVFLGLGGYFALSTTIGSLLFEVAPTDLTTLSVAVLLLALVALLACLLPARRAVQVDPMTALRSE